MTTGMEQPRILLVTFPAQGHLNPALQFAKRLIRLGAHVTLATSVAGHRRMTKALLYEGLSLAPYSDGYDDGFKPGDDPGHYMAEMKRLGIESLRELIVSSANEGKPFSCVLGTLLMPWAMDVACQHQLPSALLWIQPAMVFDIYYYYFNGYGGSFDDCRDPSHVLELPGLPPFTSRDIPSFLVPSESNAYNFILPLFQEQMETLNKESQPKILVNTFDALEPEGLKSIEKLNLVGIGPLIPSAFLDGKDPSDTSTGCDFFQSSTDYVQWLNSQPNSSVVYVSFGSISVLSKKQMEELARGLLDSKFRFLWVIREEQNGKEKKEDDDDKMLYRKELEQEGLIVPWCSQVEVLSHRAIGCFLTHCGWNSTLESLVSGVPMVAFPQWTDQGTNAKLIEDVWHMGVRVVVNEEGIVEGNEIKRCLDLVMTNGEKGEEMKRNASKWKQLAREAVMEGTGSSEKNLKAFIDEVRKVNYNKKASLP